MNLIILTLAQHQNEATEATVWHVLGALLAIAVSASVIYSSWRRKDRGATTEDLRQVEADVTEHVKRIERDVREDVDRLDKEVKALRDDLGKQSNRVHERIDHLVESVSEVRGGVAHLTQQVGKLIDLELRRAETPRTTSTRNPRKA